MYARARARVDSSACRRRARGSSHLSSPATCRQATRIGERDVTRWIAGLSAALIACHYGGHTLGGPTPAGVRLAWTGFWPAETVRCYDAKVATFAAAAPIIDYDDDEEDEDEEEEGEEDGAHDEGTRASNAGTDHASSDHGSGAPDAAPDGEGEAQGDDDEQDPGDHVSAVTAPALDGDSVHGHESRGNSGDDQQNRRGSAGSGRCEQTAACVFFRAA